MASPSSYGGGGGGYGSPSPSPSPSSATSILRTSIRLFTVNDIYTFRDIRGMGGYPMLKSIVEKHRTPYSLFTINGDLLGGSQLAEAFKGESAMKIIDSVEADMLVVGNHEFDYGPDRLEELIKGSSSAWLVNNVRRISKNNQLLGGTYIIYMISRVIITHILTIFHSHASISDLMSP